MTPCMSPSLLAGSLRLSPPRTIRLRVACAAARASKQRLPRLFPSVVVVIAFSMWTRSDNSRGEERCRGLVGEPEAPRLGMIVLQPPAGARSDIQLDAADRVDAQRDHAIGPAAASGSDVVGHDAVSI